MIKRIEKNVHTLRFVGDVDVMFYKSAHHFLYQVWRAWNPNIVRNVSD